MSWAIYYSDKTTISSEDATPFSIEHRTDVQVIIQDSHDHNWVTLSGYDYYVWDIHGDETKWWGVDKFGLHHYWLQPGCRCILLGTWTNKKNFREILDRARAEFGDKPVFERSERKP